MPNKNSHTAMSDAERAEVMKVAGIYGLTEQEAIDCLAKGGLARRVKIRTGRNPAKVYPIRPKKI